MRVVMIQTQQSVEPATMIRATARCWNLTL
jgi:hypothetical protein